LLMKTTSHNLKKTKQNKTKNTAASAKERELAWQKITDRVNASVL